MRLFEGIMRWLVPAALCVAMQACNVMEDETDCYAPTSITFSFTRNGQESFGAEVPSLSVFVFDRHYRFVGRWDENDNTKFGAGYTMTLPLKPGIYSIVTWGGLKENSYYVCNSGESHGQQTDPVVGQTGINDLLVRVSCDSRNAMNETKHYVDYIPAAMFFGRVTDRALETGKVNNVTIELVKNTKKVNMTIKGIPPSTTRANPCPHMDIYMDSPNGGYDFGNGHENGGNTFTYVPQNVTAGAADSHVSELHTMRMTAGRGHRLVIWNTESNSRFYTADLLDDYIMKSPAYSTQAAVDAEDTFDITIELAQNGDGTYIGTKVTVNGWEMETSGGIIQ